MMPNESGASVCYIESMEDVAFGFCKCLRLAPSIFYGTKLVAVGCEELPTSTYKTSLLIASA